MYMYICTYIYLNKQQAYMNTYMFNQITNISIYLITYICNFSKVIYYKLSDSVINDECNKCNLKTTYFSTHHHNSFIIVRTIETNHLQSSPIHIYSKIHELPKRAILEKGEHCVYVLYKYIYIYIYIYFYIYIYIYPKAESFVACCNELYFVLSFHHNSGRKHRIKIPAGCPYHIFLTSILISFPGDD